MGLRLIRGWSREYTARGKRRAAVDQRAGVATRSSRHANDCTEVDQSEPKLARALLGQEVGQNLPHHRVVPRASLRRRNVQCPTDESNDVRIEQWTPLSKSQNEYRVGDVRPHTRQPAKLIFSLRNSPLKVGNQGPGECGESLAPVEQPQRTKQVYNYGWIGHRQGVRGRVGVDERVENFGHEVGPRPLEEELRNKNGVRITVDAPRKRTPMLLKPPDHAAAQPPMLSHGSGCHAVALVRDMAWVK